MQYWYERKGRVKVDYEGFGRLELFTSTACYIVEVQYGTADLDIPGVRGWLDTK